MYLSTCIYCIIYVYMDCYLEIWYEFKKEIINKLINYGKLCMVGAFLCFHVQYYFDIIILYRLISINRLNLANGLNLTLCCTWFLQFAVSQEYFGGYGYEWVMGRIATSVGTHRCGINSKSRFRQVCTSVFQMHMKTSFRISMNFRKDVQKSYVDNLQSLNFFFLNSNISVFPNFPISNFCQFPTFSKLLQHNFLLLKQLTPKISLIIHTSVKQCC